MKKLIIPLLTMSSLIGCTNSDQHVTTREIVNISEVHMPNNGEVNQNIEIGLKAEATSACWSDLIVTMNRIDDYHFLFKVTGLVVNNRMCAAVMIYKDTIISFRPELQGKYFFQTMKAH